MIDAALKRIQGDEYGVCANCQEELQQKRLEAVPWASIASVARKRWNRDCCSRQQEKI